MKKLSYVMVILGVIAIIVGTVTFTNLNYANAVDSNPWTIYLNGIRSFQWPRFLGMELIILGLIVYTTSDQAKGHRIP